MRFLDFMNTRVGRSIRVVMALGVALAGLAIGGGLGVGLGLFSLMILATAVFGVCPVNPLIGQPMRACSVDRATRSRPATR